MTAPRDVRVSRRDVLKLTVGGGAGLAVGGLLDWPALKAATENLKLSNVNEFTTSCNFCSCGCGMIAQVRDGKLLKMEGDYDHIVNRGSLCVKGISMFATHASPQRLTKPRYRAPGTDHWVEISWDDAIGFMGGAQNTNEECYLFQKAARLLGMAYVEHQARL